MAFGVAGTAAALILALSCGAATVDARQSAEASSGEVETDSDPTRPVFVSIRPEFYNFDQRDTQLLIVRYDSAVRRTVILRFEVPAARSDDGEHATSGLGDAYGQVLIVPYASGRFAVVAGSGPGLATATDARLGGDKWVLTPIAAPLWRLRRGLAYLKLQNFTSVAGSDNRQSVNYLLVTPTIIHAVGDAWWLLADTETKTNWRQDGRTGVKSGLQFGRHMTK